MDFAYKVEQHVKGQIDINTQLKQHRTLVTEDETVMVATALYTPLRNMIIHDVERMLYAKLAVTAPGYKTINVSMSINDLNEMIECLNDVADQLKESSRIIAASKGKK